MSNWKKCVLGDLVKSMQLGTNALGSEENIGLPLLKMGNLTVGGFNFSKLERLKVLPEQAVKPFLLNKGDFLFNTRNTLELVGKSAVWNNQLPQAVFNSNIMRIKFKDGVDDFFMGYYFENYLGWSEFKKFSIGTTSVAAIYSRDLLKSKVHLPSYPVQKKITKILRTVGGQIEKTEAIIAKYKAIKQGLMQDLFTRGIDVATGKLRPRYQDAPELYKPSPLGMIPKEWDIDAVQDLCSKVTDGAHFSPKPLDYGYRIGNVKDMTDYGFDYKGMTQISRKDFQELARQNCSPKKGDVLLSKDGTIGRVIVFNDDEQVVLLSSIAILTPYEHINSTYLGYLFKTSYFDVQLYQLQSGSALKRLVLSDIRKIKFPIPKDGKEQELIASRLERADKLLKEEMDHRQKLQLIKKGLMSDLLSGKVRVQVDEEAVY